VAIKQEEFEEAAILRDKIRAMETKKVHRYEFIVY